MLLRFIGVRAANGVRRSTNINQAATRAAQISPNSVIAVTDREGYVLGVWSVRGGEPTAAEIATCVSKAGPLHS